MNAIILLGSVLVFATAAAAHGDLGACFNMPKVIAEAKKVDACKNLEETRTKRHHNPRHTQITACINELYDISAAGKNTIDMAKLKKSVTDLAIDSTKRDAMIKIAVDCNKKNVDVIPAEESHAYEHCFWDTIIAQICPGTHEH